MSRAAMATRLAAIAFVVSAALPAPGAAVDEARAAALLSQPVQVDAVASRVLARSHAAYARLNTLETTSKAGTVTTVAYLKRPRYCHVMLKRTDGELIGLSVCDGRRYYSYAEASRKYVERDPSVVTDLVLPINVRPFFVDIAKGIPMNGLDGKPSVREYAFRAAGTQKIGGRTVDGVEVSTLVRRRSGATTFNSTRYYDRVTGLLVLVAEGGRKLPVRNVANPKLAADSFAWKPIPGSTRSFD